MVSTMTVFVLIKNVDYEGGEFLGVFESQESARAFARKHLRENSDCEDSPDWKETVQSQWEWRRGGYMSYAIIAETVRE